MFFVDVILPLPLQQVFTYSVPTELAMQVNKGVRVIVPFGARKFYSAIVREIRTEHAVNYHVKEILAVLDEQPIVNDLQMQLWQWIASYYMCFTGDVMKAAIPAGLKLESETKVFYNDDFVQCEELNKNETEVLNIVHDKKSLPVSEIAALYKHKNLMKTLQSLVDMEALWVEEIIAGRFKPRLETYVRLNDEISNEKKLQTAFNALEKAPKQLEILMSFIQLSGVFSNRSQREPSKKELLQAANAQADAFNGLVAKKILEPFEKEISRLKTDNSDNNANLPTLSASQQTAIDAIQSAFAEKDVTLLHGVTSSGKTEIYIRLIDEQIKNNRQVLYMLPEIALTAQIINRLKNVFGNKVGIYHSKFSDAERVEVWNNIGKAGGYDVVLGVRSSIFLPFSKLGLIIIDEEHENTYKQYDPAPRYNARDAAIMLASLHGAKTILGSATPSVESYYNAKEGKYALVELTQRYAGIELPATTVLDIALARKQKIMQSHFHPEILAEIEKTLKAEKQIILFQNRRGFAPYVQCRICEFIPRCEHCDVCLTYHKYSDRLVCHYCGYNTDNITQCTACGSLDVGDVGYGTEKIEDELQIIFPDARIERLDLDNTRTRNKYETILNAFEQGKTDILVGTQMVTKGLNFENVQLAVVMNADHLLSFPDFRAFERSYQLMTQVSGRAGRAGKRGKALIQTSRPQHHILQFVINNDYAGMYTSQIMEREKFKYPPFYRMIRLTLKHKSKDIARLAAKDLAKYLEKIFGRRVLGPETPIVSRINNYYLENIWLKIEKKASAQKAKIMIAEAIQYVRKLPDYKSLQIVPDVDPM